MSEAYLADHLRAGRLRRRRGHLQGLLHPAHAADVGRQRHPRRDPDRRDPGRRLAESGVVLALALVAVVLAAINMVGGFVVTDRMLVMFRPKKLEQRRTGSWSGDPGLGPARLPGRRGLLHPRPEGPVLPAYGAARQPDRAAGAVLATVIVFAATPLDHVVPILVALAIGTGIGAVGAYRVQMTQMPQLVALFNGVGGGAAAIVALIELDQILFRLTATTSPTPAPTPFTLVITAFTLAGRRGQLRRLGGHVPQAAGADDQPPGHLPGLPGGLRPRPGRRGRRRRRAGARPGDAPRRAAGPARGRPRRTPGPAGRRRRRADRHLAAQRLHRPDRRGQRLPAGEHPAAGRRHPGRLGRHPAHPADGQRHGPLAVQHPVRRAPGRLDPGLDPLSDRPVKAGRRGGRGDPARVRRAGDHRPGLRPGRGPGPARR